MPLTLSTPPIVETEDVQGLIDATLGKTDLGAMVPLLTQKVKTDTEYVEFSGMFDDAKYVSYIFKLSDVEVGNGQMSLQFISAGTGLITDVTYRYHQRHGESSGTTETGVATFGDNFPLYTQIEFASLTINVSAGRFNTVDSVALGESTNGSRLKYTTLTGTSDESFILSGVRMRAGNGSSDFIAGTFSLYGILK